MPASRKPPKGRRTASQKSRFESTSATFFMHRPARENPSKSAMPNFDARIHIPDMSGYTSEQRDALGTVFMMLTLLNHYVRCFESAVQLYTYVHSVIVQSTEALEHNASDEEADEYLEITDGWPVIAGRDGAMSIYHFSILLDDLNSAIRKCPQLITQESNTKRALARRMLHEAFPDIVAARDAIAHAGKKVGNDSEIAEHSFDGDWTNHHIEFRKSSIRHNAILIDVLSNGQYSNTWKGRVISYQLNLESVKALARVRDEIYAALRVDQEYPLPTTSTEAAKID